MLAEGCYDAEGVKAYATALTALYRFCLSSSISQGQDCTYMLTNPDFTSGFSGWTKSGADIIGNYAGITPELPTNVEVYNGNVNIYQEVTDIQPGICSVTSNVFERPSANGSYNGTEVSKVSLFINDFMTLVQNICDDAMAAGVATSVPVDVTEQRCTEEYRNYSLVFTLPDRSEVTLGFMSMGTMEARWFVCDNFRLTYFGEDSQLTATPDEGQVDVQAVSSGAAPVPVSVCTLSGTRLSRLRRGINVVSFSDGSLKKILVK